MPKIKIVKQRPSNLFLGLSTPYLKEAKDYARLMKKKRHNRVVIWKRKNFFPDSKLKWRYEVFRDKY